MASRICYHCKQGVEAGEAHDCWTTTEAALTGDLSEDLQEAWQRLRETAVAFGEQRIYASHNSIMFSRRSCYFFVRPKKQFLEVCLFLGRTVAGPMVRRSAPASKTKVYRILHLRHRNQVEAPLTDWLREAFDWSAPAAAQASSRGVVKPGTAKHAVARKVDAATPAPRGRERSRGRRPDLQVGRPWT